MECTSGIFTDLFLDSRPVTLVGFSLGARVIFKCLSHLAEAGEDNGKQTWHVHLTCYSHISWYYSALHDSFSCCLAACLVERVVLLGAPISINDEGWKTARKVDQNLCTVSLPPFRFLLIHIVLILSAAFCYCMEMVAGRFVNAYSRNDWTLGIVCRARYHWNQLSVLCLWCHSLSMCIKSYVRNLFPLIELLKRSGKPKTKAKPIRISVNMKVPIGYNLILFLEISGYGLVCFLFELR